MSFSANRDAATNARTNDSGQEATTTAPSQVDTRQVDALLTGTLGNPHGFLGMHPVSGPDGQATLLQVRVYAPTTERVTLVEQGGQHGRVQLDRVHDAGIFAATIAGREQVFPYVLEMTRDEHTWTQGDPYRFLPTIGEQDLYFIGEGTHRRMYERLGAHPRTVDGVAGVAFAVWAPAARGVSLMGGFNGWNRRSHPLRALGSSGIWELFIPGLGPGEHYKYAIRGADGVEREKADPLAFASELRPKTASIVADIDSYAWHDAVWMAARRETNLYRRPMSIYEVHLGSWRKKWDGSWLSYGELADELIPYVREMGFTHIELLPVAEHPYDGSWGYQVTGFYAPTSRHGSPADFQAFVDRCHQAGIGVLLDWVPAHFAIDEHSLQRFDGTFLYEHEDPRKRTQPDWGTFAFNYGRHEVRNFLLANALFWLEKYHIDGLRVDAVSSMLYLDYSRRAGEWVPNKFGGREHLEALDFLKAFNELVYSEGDGAITIAEESTSWPGVSRPLYAGGLGFGFKWNMGWMHDTLEYFRHNPIYRQYHQGMLTFAMVYAYTENFILSLSHDEVVHGKGSLLHKMPGDEWQQFANLRLLYAYQWAMPGKKLIFMGDEFGQRGEWNHDTSVEWHALTYGPHDQLRRLVADLNHLLASEPALHAIDHEPAGFSWLDFSDATNSVLSFARRAPAGEHGDDYIVCAFNFTPVPRENYRIPVPEPIRFREIFNSDAGEYGGGGMGNMGLAHGETVQHNEHPFSVSLTLPPLGAVFLKPDR